MQVRFLSARAWHATALAVGLASVAAAPAHAQATRTWVSGVGDDANPCSRTSPCKTFAGAISKTASSGEISVLDPGGYGALTITKPISIVAQGSEGSVLVAGTAGITINAGPNDNVSLYGLSFEGTGTGTAGLRVLQAGNVYVSKAIVHGFLAGSGYGIDIEPASSAARIYLKNVEVTGNLTGIYLHGGAATAGLVIDTCTISLNASNSLVADTSTSVARALGSSFATTPVSITNGAQLISGGNNFFSPGGGPTSTSPLQ